MRNIIHLTAAMLLAATLPTAAEEARSPVDLVIAQDVSGSMSALIVSAKQRLWDVVNTLGRAQPQPDLRVAIISYGNPSYGAGSGYVRIDQPLTADLDSVNETLFAFSTNGGDEYVARAVAEAIDGLHWSAAEDAMRVVFVAGNESAEQDPALALRAVLQRATDDNITVNAIYCGAENDSIAAGWRQIAALTQGTFASIDQNANVVAAIETPVDRRLAELSEALNDTYIPYGDAGALNQARQKQQDDNAAEMSVGALASRVITKASALYDSAKWDLIDAFESVYLASPDQAVDQVVERVLRATPAQQHPA